MVVSLLMLAAALQSWPVTAAGAILRHQRVNHPPQMPVDKHSYQLEKNPHPRVDHPQIAYTHPPVGSPVLAPEVKDHFAAARQLNKARARHR